MVIAIFEYCYECVSQFSGKRKALLSCQQTTKIKEGNVLVFLFSTTPLSFQIKSRYPLQSSLCFFICSCLYCATTLVLFQTCIAIIHYLLMLASLQVLASAPLTDDELCFISACLLLNSVGHGFPNSLGHIQWSKCCLGRGQSAQGVSEGKTAGMLVRPRGGSK